MTNHDFALAAAIQRAQLRGTNGIREMEPAQIMTNHDLVIPEIIQRAQLLASRTMGQRLQCKIAGCVARARGLKTNSNRVCNKGVTRKFQFSIQGGDCRTRFLPSFWRSPPWIENWNLRVDQMRMRVKTAWPDIAWTAIGCGP